MDLANGCWLPSHVLVELLRHVAGDEAQNVAAVSKLWRACLWESRSIVEFRVGESGSASSAVHELAARFPLSTTLRVVAHPLRPFDLSRFSLCRPLAFPSRLSTLELHKVQIDAGTLDGLLHASQLRVIKCSHVEFIDVARWKHSVPVASSASGEPHPTGPASVTSLSLTDCQFLTARGVGRQAEKKKALSAFLRAFGGVAELTLESMELSDGLLGGYLAGLDDLATLNLAGSRGFSYRAIARVQRFKLKELVLSACYVLNEDMCRVICTVCPGLETLGVYEGQISTTTVNLISSLSHLKTLDMGYSDGDVSPIDLQRMLARLKGLRVLNLGGVAAVNDFVMLEVARMASLKRCALTLACVGDRRRRRSHSRHALRSFASLVRIARSHRSFASLASERLDISGCPSVTSDGYGSLRKLESLEELSCGWTSTFGDDEVEALPPSIVDLDVSYASRLTDVGLARMSERLAGLRRLKLTSCKGLTSEGIRKVSQRNRGLLVC